MIERLTFKVCVFADKDVGKKTFASNILHEQLDENWGQVMGVEFFTKDITVNRDSNARLQLWLRPNENGFDENRFQDIWKMYIRGSLGVILMYDITNAKSLIFVSEGINLLRSEERKYDIPILLVGNKLDLEENREISKEQIEQFKEENNISESIEISLKTGENVEKMFMKLMEMILKDEVDEKHFSLEPIEIETPYIEIKYPYVKIDAPHMKCFRCFSDSVNPIDSYWEGSIRYTLFMCYNCKRIFTIQWRFYYKSFS